MACNSDNDNRKFNLSDIPTRIRKSEIVAVFKKYGKVTDVLKTSKYRVLTMATHADADAVRAALVNGRISCGSPAVVNKEILSDPISMKVDKYTPSVRQNQRNMNVPQGIMEICYVHLDLPLRQESQVTANPLIYPARIRDANGILMEEAWKQTQEELAKKHLD